MTKKKSKFWTFCFSLLPGAAEMYMGFMKMGVSLMCLFFGIFFLASFFAQGILVLADVIVWFYGFFHAHNLSSMDDEDFYALEDDYLFHLDGSGKEFWNQMVISRHRKIVAVVLILVGVSILWNNLLDLLDWLLPPIAREILYNLGYRVPQLVLAVGVIAVGIWLIRGKKQELLEEEETQEQKKEEELDGRETE